LCIRRPISRPHWRGAKSVSAAGPSWTTASISRSAACCH
jgi:hypothetical protein